MLISYSRALYYLYGVYLLYVFTYWTLPNKGYKVIIFLAIYFFNLMTQWSCYKLIRLTEGSPVLFYGMFVMQCALWLWSLYAYAFIFDYTLFPFHEDLFTETALQQYAIILPMTVMYLFYRISDR